MNFDDLRREIEREPIRVTAAQMREWIAEAYALGNLREADRRLVARLEALLALPSFRAT